MKKNVLALALLGLILAGCAGSRAQAPTAVFDLGPAAARQVPEGRWANVGLEVRAAPWIDGTAIAYRLAYDDPNRLLAYTQSRWAGPAAQLFGQRLRQQLGLASGGPCLVRLEVEELSQVFETPEKSAVVLQGHMTLADKQRKLIAERPLALNRPAAGADARGGVAAFAELAARAAQEMAAWLELQESEGKLKVCG
ncbi:MAG: membrane integrity-associated transporter subunit PqiC [Betaproteobacteria bacterium]|nr:membrane integrity-associated transporter subunit PqiC [Betaproteobacteria bacterium]